MLTQKTFQTLEGFWILERSINGEKCMTGGCTFTKKAPRLFLYHEEVRWHHGLEGYRDYFYSLENGQNLKVYFATNTGPGGLFLNLHEQENTYVGKHPCKEDLYKARFQFTLPHTVFMAFKVTGPKKSLLIESRLSKSTKEFSSQRPYPLLD